jgi:hypothetical protein
MKKSQNIFIILKCSGNRFSFGKTEKFVHFIENAEFKILKDIQ